MTNVHITGKIGDNEYPLESLYILLLNGYAGHAIRGINLLQAGNGSNSASLEEFMKQ